MMKLTKIVFVALFSILAVSSLNAQEKQLTFGLKGGLNISNFTGDSDGDSKFGFNVGATVDYAFTDNLFLMSGLELTTKGSKASAGMPSFDLGEWGTIESFNAKMSVNAMYLQIPIHIGYKLPIGDNLDLVFRGGPYVAYGVGGKFTTKVNGTKLLDINTFDMMKNFDFGLGLGVGAEFGKLGVNLGYDFGLINMADTKGTIKALSGLSSQELEGIDLGDIDSGSAKNGNFYISIGYKF